MELEGKEKQQCNILANYIIVTILLRAFTVLRHSDEKSCWKCAIIFILLLTDSKIQKYCMTLMMYLHTGESVKLKRKRKDTGESSALKYCIETPASNA